MADKANVGDVVAVARGVLSTFDDMQRLGFNQFRSADERCALTRNSALALIDRLVQQGRLAANETGI